MLFKHSHQLHHTLLIFCLSLHGTGWEQVLGVLELQGQVLGAAAPSSVPLSALKCFWLQFGNKDLHEAKPTRCPLCGSRACFWVGLKREGKEEAQQFVGRRNAEKTLGITSVWGGSKARAAAGMVQGRRELGHLPAVQPRWDGLCPTRVGFMVGVWTAWMAGGARSGLAGPWCPARADVSVPNSNSCMAVGPAKDCW